MPQTFSCLLSFVLGAVFLFFNTRAHAAVVSDPYLPVYFGDVCNNSDLFIDSASSGIASQHRVLGIIDYLNNNSTSYASELTTDKIASLAYLSTTLSMLTPDAMCCPGGYFSAEHNHCRDCGTWSTTTTISCLDEGKYLSNKTCKSCPDGYLCPAATNGRITVATQCMGAGVYRYQNRCVPCVDGHTCPAGTNSLADCGAGYYCIAGAQTECDYGARRCPGANHIDESGPLACDNAMTTSGDTTISCLDEGQYLSNKTCQTCGEGYYCPAGTNGRITVAIQCMGAGVYRIKNRCESCPDGYLCPAGQNNANDCGMGYYCVGNESFECVDGARRCPLLNNVSGDGPLACDDAITVSSETTVSCLGDGEYLKNTTCEPCPDGFTCPAGTNGRIATKAAPETTE